MYANELEQLTKDFYELFDTLISVFDREKKLLAASPHFCPFCSLVRTSPELRQRCLEHDRIALERCAQTLEPYMYHCHMGLVETAAPIVKGGMVQGYLLFGQLTDDAHNELPLTRIAALKEEIDKAQLKEALSSVRVFSREHIEAMSRMLVMCAAYIQMNNVFEREEERLIGAITDYIRNHSSEKITSAMLCRHLCISRSSLYALSVAHFGTGISAYVNKVRINLAREKLKYKNASVAQVSEETGFSDANYFCKVFKRYVGCTPSEYQKKSVK